MVRVEPTQLAFVILGASMAAIGLMILVSSFLATGATRVEVRATDTYWRSQNFYYCPFKLIVSFDSHIDLLSRFTRVMLVEWVAAWRLQCSSSWSTSCWWPGWWCSSSASLSPPSTLSAGVSNMRGLNTLGALCISVIVPGMCSTDEIQWNEGKIDFYPFNFLFPEGSQRVNMEVQGQAEIKLFCIDYVQV